MGRIGHFTTTMETPVLVAADHVRRIAPGMEDDTVAITFSEDDTITVMGKLNDVSKALFG